jgi:hypothetical protein
MFYALNRLIRTGSERIFFTEDAEDVTEDAEFVLRFISVSSVKSSVHSVSKNNVDNGSDHREV